MKEIKKWFEKVLKKIIKIGRKEKKRDKTGQLKPSPKDILFP
jgi:hypothetical protein